MSQSKEATMNWKKVAESLARQADYYTKEADKTETKTEITSVYCVLIASILDAISLALRSGLESD
jgi:hypothetical protein